MSPTDEFSSNLEPGGYHEIQDLCLPTECDDGTMAVDGALHKWQLGLVEASKKLGRPLGNAREYKGFLEKAGFINVVEKKFKWPSNTWPKDPKYKTLGMWQLANAENGLEAWTLALYTRALGWSKEQVLTLCANVRKDIRNPKIHAYWNM
jgi:hypothetical protein